MLKNTHFIIISLFFALVLILFLIFNPDSYPIMVAANTNTVLRRNEADSDLTSKNLNHQADIAVITETNSITSQNILHTLSLLKKTYNVYDSLLNLDIGNEKTIIIDADYIGDTDIDKLKEFLSNGGRVIFTSLPETVSEQLAKLLGILSFEPEFNYAGFTIYEGILIGGAIHAENYPLTCSKVTLSSRCKVFGDAYSEEVKLYETPREEREAAKNPIIWRTFYESGSIFVINAPYMEELSGAGVLTGILSQAYGDFIYPVIGTKTVVLDNFPYITDENFSIGNRSAFIYNRDVIWPELLSLARNLDITYTCFTNGNFLKNTESFDLLEFFNNELYKATRGELGYSLLGETGFSTVENDINFFNSNFPLSAINSLKINSDDFEYDPAIFNNITSVLSETETSSFNWLHDTTISLPLASSGTENNSDFAFAGFLTAFGYVMHSIDLSPVFIENESWNNAFIEISGSLSRNFSNLNYLQASSVRNTTEYVKNYLNMNVSCSQTEKSISVSIQNSQNETSFLLRSRKEINMSKCEGFTVEKIEDYVYMIVSSVSDFTVEFV